MLDAPVREETFNGIVNAYRLHVTPGALPVIEYVAELFQRAEFSTGNIEPVPLVGAYRSSAMFKVLVFELPDELLSLATAREVLRFAFTAGG
jgi:hypothetical protein